MAGLLMEKGRNVSVDVRRMRAIPERIAPDPRVLELAGDLAPGFYLDVGNVCNQRCLYCAVPRDRSYETTLEQATDTAGKAVALGYDCCILIGGEPTIWRQMQAALPALGRAGVRRVVLTTNGLMLSYARIADFLVSQNVGMVMLSLDDPDDAVQSRLTGRGDNPALVRQALANLRERHVRTCLYSVVTRLALGRGERLGREFARIADAFDVAPALVLAGLKPVEDARRHATALHLSLTETAAEVRAAAAAAGTRLAVAFRDIPLCLVTDMAGLSLDVYHENAAVDLESGRTVPAALAADRDFASQCAGCGLRAWCPGMYKDYLREHGTGEFHPQ
jgi:pyruvate-formate lyase-activating enzyme